MTEQNGYEEHERNSARDGDAGFAALDATESYFGSSALGNSVSFEPVAPPVEVGGFEALNFEAPAALAEPTLTWEVPPAAAEEPPYPDEPPYEDEPAYPAEPLYPETEYPEAEYAGEYWAPSDEVAPAEAIAEQRGGQETAPQKPKPKARQAEKPAHKKKSAATENASKKWVRNRVADSIAAEEFPDWHPASHGFVEESIARDNGGDYAGEFRVPELPLQAVPGNFEDGSSGEDGESPRRSLLVDPNLPAVSIDEAPARAFTPGGAEPRPMAAGRMSRAGAASIGSGLTAEEKEEIERQAAQRDKQKKRKSSRASKNTDYKRGFRRMSAAQEEKMRSRSPYAPAFGARSDDEETRKSPADRGSGSNLFREGSSLNEELTPAHRLDRGTSGLLLLTKRREVRGAYQELFARREVDKMYEAIAPYVSLSAPADWSHHLVKVAGEAAGSVLVDEEPNSHTEVASVTRLPAEQEQELQSLYGVNAPLGRYVLHPTTGRTHQLRLQMMTEAAPILGDTIYPVLLPADAEDFSRPMRLRCIGLGFVDPLTGENRSFALN